nr:hypothetical protein [Tanacetum cinerariifolium]
MDRNGGCLRLLDEPQYAISIGVMGILVQTTAQVTTTCTTENRNRLAISLATLLINFVVALWDPISIRNSLDSCTRMVHLAWLLRYTIDKLWELVFGTDQLPIVVGAGSDP